MRLIGIAVCLVMGGALTAWAADSTEPHPRAGSKLPYPEEARRLQVAGDVVFVARVDEMGKVTAVEVREVPMRGLGFEESVSEAVKKWRFDPASKDGRPVAGEHVGRVTFRLRPEDETLIAETVAAFARAWNGGDPEAFAETFAPEGKVRTALGPTPTGASAVREWASTKLAAARPRLRAKPGGMNFWAADLATVRVPLEDGRRDVFLMVSKQGEKWLVRSLDDAALTGAPGAAYRAGEPGIKEPRKTKHVPPSYPDGARQARIQGTVVLECVISAEGAVTDVQVVSGPEALRRAAVEAVRQWKYEPTTVGGGPVPVMMTVTVSFHLRP